MQKMMFVTKEELLKIIDDIRKEIAEDDSYGGYLNYDAMDPEMPEGKDFGITAGYRIGNLEFGQGYFRLIGAVVNDNP